MKQNAWIERDETGPSQFKAAGAGDSYQIDDAVTLGSIACAEKSIVVGSYDAHKAGELACGTEPPSVRRAMSFSH